MNATSYTVEVATYTPATRGYEFTTAVTFPRLVEALYYVTREREDGDGTHQFTVKHPDGRVVTRGEARAADLEGYTARLESEWKSARLARMFPGAARRGR